LSGVTVNLHGGSETIAFALRDGIQVDRNLFNVTEIEALRDSDFAGETFTFELHNIQNTLDWFEKEILLPNNLRFATGAGLYTFVLLDQTPFGSTIEFNSTNVIGKPSYKTSNRSVRTKCRINYGWNVETSTYSTFQELTDASALANYGEQETFIVNSKGIPDTAGGDTLATSRLSIWSERLSTTRPVIVVKTFFSEFDLNIGTGVLVTLSLPDQTGTLAYAKDLEVQKKSVDLAKGIITWELTATAETGLRRAFISPTEILASAPTTTTLTVPSGRGDAEWAAAATKNWEVRFVNATTGAAISGPFGISARTTDTFTIDEAHGASTGDRMKFANYDEVATDQKRYGFTSNNATPGFASDGTLDYQITFN
jgi:hypothetical protein